MEFCIPTVLFALLLTVNYCEQTEVFTNSSQPSIATSFGTIEEETDEITEMTMAITSQEFVAKSSTSSKADENKDVKSPSSYTLKTTTSASLTTEKENEIIKRIEENPGLNSAIEAILVVVVLQTMLGLGCTMEIALIKEHLLQPLGIGIAASCQFGIMPLVAFLMSKIFSLDKVAAIAVIVTGSCPGGNLSNLLTYFLYGDMNLSILMSTVSTLLALALMPLCLFIYGSSWIEVSAIGRIIPFGGIILTLIITLIPVAIGVFIKARFEKLANTLLKISLFSVGVAFVALMTLSGMLFGFSMFAAISAKAYVIAIIQPLIGYGSGYLLATGFRLPDASKRTVAIETGCQNSQLSSTILKMAFASDTMGAYFLFPIYYALFQALEGLGMVLAFRAYRRYYADDVMVPVSRVTYGKFDGDSNDGEDMRDAHFGKLYQNSSSNSDSSVYGNLTLDQENGTTRMQEVPKELPLKQKFSPEEPKKQETGDKTNLIQNEDQGGLGYGGLQ